MIYFQHLSLLSTVQIAQLSKLCNAASSPTIYYIDGSKFNVTLVSILSKLKGIEVEQLKFEMINIRSDSGELIRLQIPRGDLFAVEQEILESEEIKELLSEQEQGGRLSEFVIKRILCGAILDPQSISMALYIINVVSRHAHTACVANPVLIVPGRAWFRFLEGYANDIGVKLAFVRPGFGDLTARFAATAKRFPRVFAGLKMLAELRRTGVGFFVSNKPQTSVIAKCLVEAKGAPNVDDNGEFSDFFWQIDSTFDRSRIAYSNQERTDAHRLRQEGISPTFSRPCIPTVAGSRPTFRTKFEFKSESASIKEVMAEYQAYFCYWNSLFQQENIKIHLGWYKYDAKHMVIADAMRQAGGIAAVYQFGFEGYRNYECRLSTDVVFGYSNFSAEMERNLDSSISHFVITGLLRNYNPASLVNKAGEIREKLSEAGARKVVCVLDENSLSDSRWHTGHELQRENYSVMLEELMRTPWLGLIFKPKVPKTLRSRLGPVNDLLTAAEQTGRCVILETKGVGHFPSTPVLLAGLASDVVVHSHLVGGTAALECALSGIPTVLIDREFMPMSKLYELPSGKVRFDNWTEAAGSLVEHLGTKKGIPGFGIWDKGFLREMDPFLDDQGAARMGAYLQWLIEGFDRRQHRDTVLEEAASRYCDLWGNDKVISIGDCR